MHWKTLETILSDQHQIVSPEEAERDSLELMEDLREETRPLHAAKIAYAIAILYLKSHPVHEQKALQFVDYFEAIIQHEIVQSGGHSALHLSYLRSLARHNYHHLLLLSERADKASLTKHLKKLLSSHHGAHMKEQGVTEYIRSKEQRMIQSALVKHHLVAGFVLAMTAYFAGSSFLKVSDFAAAQMIFTEPQSSLADLVFNALLLIFTLSIAYLMTRFSRSRT